jgi:hypothetical protein
MISHNNFKKITVTENSIVLVQNNNKINEILIADLDKINIKVNNGNPAYVITFIALPTLLLLILYLFLRIDLIIVIPIFLFVVFYVTTTTYVNYSIKVSIRNGTIIEEKISKKFKLEAIGIVSEIQKIIYTYKINNVNKSVREA